MQEMGNATEDGPSPSRRETVFPRQGLHSKRARTILSRCCDHRLAMLVHQGSDPTPPYQALVIRESAKFYVGLAPIGSKAFSARVAGSG